MVTTRPKLTMTTYQKPGTYVGQLYLPKPINLGAFPRVVTFIGKGVPFIIAENLEIVRSFVYREKLTFSQASPFVAVLSHPSNGSQRPSGNAVVRLYNSQDQEIDARYWKFTKSSSTSGYDQVQVFSVDYDPNATYYLDYQSTDVTVPDVLPVTGLRQVRLCGDRRYEDFYKDSVDFQMLTEIQVPVKVSGNGTGTVAITTGATYLAQDRTYTLTVESNQSISMPTLGAVTAGGSNTGTGSVAIASTTAYTGAAPLTYTLTVANLVTSNGVTTLDLQWTDGTNNGTVTNVSSAAPSNVLLTAGIRLSLTGMSAMVNGDTFTFNATNVQVVHVQLSWFSDDYQASTGLIDLYDNAPTTGIAIESGLLLDFSNLSGFVAADPNNGIVADSWTIVCNNLDALNWNFTRSDTKDFNPDTDIYYDSRGIITGTPRSYYFTLPHIPVGTVTVETVETTPQAVPVTPVAGTPYVRLVSKPTKNIRASYSYRNAPEVGHTYYTTVSYTRPTSMYNSPLLYTKWEDFRNEIGSPSADNHLAIMGDYAFNVAQNTLVACVQVMDGDHDGAYNTADYAAGLEASLKRKDLTDIVVLGKFSSLSDQMYNSQFANDPFEQAYRLFWIGYPINYAVGTPEDPDTIAYTSSKILQVSGANPAHGTFISVANRWVKRTFLTSNNSPVQQTLDGSFLAGMIASINCAFSDMNTLLVNQAIPGIDDIDSFDEVEVKILGSSSNLYAIKLQDGSAKIIDAVTTDTAADDYHEINAMVVKQYVNKRVARDCNSTLINYVPRNVDDGVTHVRGVLRRILTSMIGEGIISSYTTQDGTPRDIIVDDIDVWRDEDNKTRYNFTFWFNMRYGIKYVTGLYSVDENAFRSTGA